MHGRCHRIEKAGIGVRREIHRDARTPRDGADDFDVEHDLSVRPVRVAAGLIGAVVHRNSRHGRGRNPKSRKVRLEVLWPKAPAELDDRHAFALR